jgi:outer membrane protein assembly factor BamB
VNNLSYGGIAASDRYVFVTDMNTNGAAAVGLVRFNTYDGSAQRFAAADEYIDVTLGWDGLLYALDIDESNIRVFNPDTLASVRNFTLKDGAADENVRAIAVNAAGEIFAASWDDNLYKFAANGTLLLTRASGQLDPSDIDLGQDGTIAVGSRLGNVTITNESLASVTSFNVGSQQTFAE